MPRRFGPVAGLAMVAVLMAASATAASGAPSEKASGAAASQRPARGGVWSAAGWASDTGNTVTDVANAISASGAAAAGIDGTGVGIALIDTGVVPVPGLPAAHVVNGPDLSFESQTPQLRYLDNFGHGTHLAGIMIGNDPSTGLRGIAPGAKLTSVKVGAGNGAVDVSQVLAALNWVVAHRNDDPRNPIRVINLAYGTDADSFLTNDPLRFAVESARGTVHVVSGSTALTGEKGVLGSFDSATWAQATTNGTAWRGGLWMGRRMAGDGWTGTSWASATWAAGTWSGADWGTAPWNDPAWSARYWSAGAWTGRYWSARYWSSSDWSAKTWSSAAWG